MARRPFIAGNWKMNLGPVQADALARALKSALAGQSAADVAVAPPAISIPAVAARLHHTGILVAAQDLHPEPSGAFTGELSGEMLREAGCAYAIVGHSERRDIFHEDDSLVRRKLRGALRAGLLPILCVGEHLDQRDAGRVAEIVLGQLGSALDGLAPDRVASLTLAYEPVWAIGTGRTASPEQAQQVHALLRSWLHEQYPAYVARQLRILYGGSVKPDNAAALLACPDIDGALVGGASLDAGSFSAIIDQASR